MASELKSWLVEPIDPLVFGDGRSIGTIGVAKSKPLPPPSQLAGAVRSQAGSDSSGMWVKSPADVLPLRVLGPIGAVLDEDGRVVDFWLPKPADVVVMVPGEGERLKRLKPLSLPEGCAWGPGAGAAVGMPEPDPRKPDSKAKRYWSWNHGLRPWLEDGRVDEARFEIEGPAPEERTHVAVGETETVLDGALYGVTGQRFHTAQPQEGEARHPWGARPKRYVRYAFLFRTDATFAFKAPVRPLGGERRLASWREAGEPWPEMPPKVLESIVDGHARIYLATPGHFRSGHSPNITRLLEGVGGELVAAASGRPEVVSGWDFASGRPKETRRLVPAGSVFFVKLGGDAAARRAWAERTWLSPISDDEQSPKDGYGLALLGAWDGECPTPKLSGASK